MMIDREIMMRSGKIVAEHGTEVAVNIIPLCDVPDDMVTVQD
jgi:hypothetical protein